MVRAAHVFELALDYTAPRTEEVTRAGAAWNCLSATARSRGVGTRLMAFAEQRFAHRRHVFLCVSSFNRRAQQFYRRLGYSLLAEFADYIVDGHSELLLHKKLSRHRSLSPCAPLPQTCDRTGAWWPCSLGRLDRISLPGGHKKTVNK